MRRAALVALLVYAGILLRHPVFVAGGSDSSGYLNEARLFASGRVRLPVTPLRTLSLDDSFTPVFTPLGFAQSTQAGAIVPTYPPAYPLLLAVAGKVGGWDRAPFYVAPMLAVLALWAMYGVALELGLPPRWSVAAAALLAVFPTYVFQALQPATDVPATLAALVAIYAALRARRQPAFAYLAGFAFAAGVAIRPTNVLVALPLLVLLHRQWRAIVGALPAAVVLMIFTRVTYGSFFTTGYGSLCGMFSWRHLPTHVPYYGKWLALFATPLVFPLGLLVAFDRRVPRATRALLLVWFAAFFLFFCSFEPIADWSLTRYLLPAIPAAIIGALLLLRDAPRWSIVLVAVVVLTGAFHIRKLGLLDFNDLEQAYPRGVRWVERQLPPDAVLVSMQMSGAFLYYADRLTVRYDEMTPERLALLRARTRGRPWFAAVWPFEREEIPKRIVGTWTVIGKYRDVELWRLDG